MKWFVNDQKAGKGISSCLINVYKRLHLGDSSQSLYCHTWHRGKTHLKEWPKKALLSHLTTHPLPPSQEWIGSLKNLHISSGGP